MDDGIVRGDGKVASCYNTKPRRLVRMCNCGKKRRGGVAPAGEGGVRGCVGAACGGVRVATVQMTADPVPAPAPRTTTLVTVTRTIVPPPPVEELPIVDPALWGPHLWRFLHITSESSVAGPSRKHVWDALFSAMLTGLPCPECTEHYTAWYAAHPIVLPERGANLRATVQDWVRALHNEVNVRRGVPEWTGAEVIAVYGPETGGGRAAAREALAAAGAAGVGSWVIAAGDAVVRWAMV